MGHPHLPPDTPTSAAGPASSLIEASLPPHHHRDGDLTDARAILEADASLARSSFLAAVVTGEADTVRRMLADDPQLATRPGGPRGWTPILHLCFSRFLRLAPDRRAALIEIAGLLLEHGADPDDHFDQDGERETALYGACGVANDADLARLLIDAGADPNDEQCAYHSAEFDDTTCAELLIARGIDAVHRATLLLHKLDYDDPAGVRRLLDAGCDPEACGRWGKAALHQALLRGRDTMFIELLLERGADPSQAMDDGRTPYALAARAGRTDVIELLAARGADTTLSGIDALLAACAAGDRAAFDRALADSPDLYASLIDDERLAIVCAAAAGNATGVATMLDVGFDIETRGEWGGTPVHHAAWLGRAEAVRVLIERGADIESRNSYDSTSLEAAVYAACQQTIAATGEPGADSVPRADYLPVIEALLAAGADAGRITPPTGRTDVDELIRRYAAGR